MRIFLKIIFFLSVGFLVAFPFMHTNNTVFSLLDVLLMLLAGFLASVTGTTLVLLNLILFYIRRVAKP